ncbi:MAG: DUF4139 domain-containing protein [Deltaproteobacteria bacterium]
MIPILALGAILVAAPAPADTQLTIYSQDFAVIKETRTLTLPAGESETRVTDITAHLEPDSVVMRDLRDPDGIRILEQTYESDPVSEGLLLRRSEGKTLDFEITVPQTGEKRTVRGKVLRSGYVPHAPASRERFPGQPKGGGQPIVEVDGKILFGLPGKPVFDALDPDAFLKPTLLWRLWTRAAGRRDIEFSYLTGGMRWEATYNAVAPETGDTFDLVGWVTLENMSGKDFDGAQVKLMAGDVSRVRGEAEGAVSYNAMEARSAVAPPAVTERAFSEYHLYTLPRELAVRDREIKQVEFVRATGVPAHRIYVYDGFRRNPRYRGWDIGSIRTRPEYGTDSNPKVWAMLEFENRESSRLGMPLPRGTVKIYRRDIDGRNEFVGEDAIDHTPKDETVRLYTGNAFDLVGERRQTNFRLDSNNHRAEESFEIRVRNHKTEAVEVRVVEHLYRGLQWEILRKSAAYRKPDARTIEFRPRVPADGEAVIAYTVRYTW